MISKEDNSLYLFIECHLAHVGVLLPSQRFVGPGWYAGQFQLNLLERPEYASRNGENVGLTGSHGDHECATLRTPSRKSQLGVWPNR